MSKSDFYYTPIQKQMFAIRLIVPMWILIVHIRKHQLGSRIGKFSSFKFVLWQVALRLLSELAPQQNQDHSLLDYTLGAKQIIFDFINVSCYFLGMYIIRENIIYR